ncbi:aminotransferase class I/II-fold pyridoxal phosphate-dependent enzyme [Paramicrobacterium chengjingii]|uniref:Aminotransferase class I/II-fold pyridoxal phosphate-dependent enzyme n=1 Tax=Paramicrobacterium chengjingii TaxID=2769067 RepID=A0ABX6YLK2_9MICO|nr:aminotransferase class I/II-fold pyridoxal phosphate-dependent enzyme [Microbacterium chengjingii]QPZ39666.1 aminotransferase class I/II-fold pyridoxal phosphate-dependent enzyme [Microbacterium chengjingii]
MRDHGGWRKAAAGAGLLAPDGSMTETIFAEMTALAARTGAINLGQGFPDEIGPAHVLEAARAAIAAGTNQYPPGRGTLELRSAVSEHQKRFYGLDVAPETEVLATAGATEALAATILALIEPGDEVLTFEPYYDAYGALISLAGGVHTTVPLPWPHFEPDLDLLERAVTDKTRIILVNDPHNPTGTVFSAATRELIVRLAEKHGATIVTDEVYEHLTFGVRHTPIATMPGAEGRTVTISSGGKTFNTTGWKIGWLTASSDLVDAILTVKQYLTYSNGAPLQPAIAAGLRSNDRFFHELGPDLDRKRRLLNDGLRAAGFDVADSAGTYFTVADAAALGFDDAVEFCRVLPERAGVIAVPISAFVMPQHASDYSSLVRFAFCKRTEVLEQAVTQLAGLRR